MDSDVVGENCAHHRHFKMYKPAKVLTQFVFTHRKRRKRALLGDVVARSDFSLPAGTMAIGRLDEDSEGLLLLTTDGKVSERVRRKSVEKEYWVQVDGNISEVDMERLRRGVDIRLPTTADDGSLPSSSSSTMYTTLPSKVRLLETSAVEIPSPDGTSKQEDTTGQGEPRRRNKTFKGACNKCGKSGHKAWQCDRNPPAMIDVSSSEGSGVSSNDNQPTTVDLPPGIPPSRTRGSRKQKFPCRRPTRWVSITVNEGKYRQVRKMTAAVGFPTLRLVRYRIGSITLAGMAEGDVMGVNQSEIENMLCN